MIDAPVHADPESRKVTRLATVADHRAADTVDVASAILNEAERGELVELMAVGVDRDGNMLSFWTSSPDIVRLMGALEWMKTRCLE